MTDEQLCKAYRDTVDIKFDKLRVEVKANKELADRQSEWVEKAVSLAREILDKKMDAENRIREELREQTASFVTRSEFNINLKNVTEKAEILAKETSKLDGRMVAICFVIPIIISILMMALYQMVMVK